MTVLLKPLNGILGRWRPAIGWSSFLLVVAATWMVALGVMDAEWVREDALFVYAALASVILTAVLARTRLSGRWGAPILGLAGLLYVANGVAHFLPPPLAALGELWNGIVWLWFRGRRAGWAAPAFPAWHESGARLAILGQRLASWAVGLSGDPVGPNPVAFTLVVGLILWASTAWGVWGVLRSRHPLLAMLPMGAVLGISTYLSSERAGYVPAFAACVVLLLPLIHLSRQEQRWDREGVDYSTEIRLDVWQVALLAMLGLLLLALVTPSLSVPDLARSFWQRVSRPRAAAADLWTRFFGGVESPSRPELPWDQVARTPSERAEASLPRSHLLGGNPSLSNQMVMRACIDAPPPVFDEHDAAWVGPQYYWRGVTYGTFDGRQWTNGPTRVESAAAYEPLLDAAITHTLSLKQRYLIQVPHGVTLYAVGEPYTVDQPVRARKRAAGDLVGLEAESKDYVVSSRVPQATVRQLESASASYPEPVVQRYLQVPDALPDRVRVLAGEITQRAGSPYATAVAIERYLRQFPYDLHVSLTPRGQDVVDYFLFETQRGYCDYYASSFVVLARLAGIPARLAVGYATGTYDLERGCYTVTEMDAHSWPEVFFPDYGWIPFEPTAAFSPFQRLEDGTSPSPGSAGPPAIPRRPWHVAVREWWRHTSRDGIAYLVAACTLVLLVLLIVRVRGWRFHSRLPPGAGIALCYQELAAVGQRFGAMRQPFDTPAEYRVRLVAAIHGREARWPWPGASLAPAVARAQQGIQALIEAYVRASYSPRAPDSTYRVQVDRLWRHLKRQLWWLRLASHGSTPASSGAPEISQQGARG